MATHQVLIDAFAYPFNRHDLDAVMSMMTEDCVFPASAGDEVEGKRIVGQQAVREAFAAVLASTPEAQWHTAEHSIDGDRACTRWRFTGTTVDGAAVEAIGCDLFHFRGDKIWIEDTMGKQSSSGT